MAKVFRIYNDDKRKNISGEKSITGWADSDKYDKKSIERIKDPNGDNPNRDITSIPTPWARLELVKQAFREVNRLGLDGQSIYHRMVSDALDVAEIFFNIDKLRDQFEILEWEVGKGLDAMKHSANVGVQLMGKGLSLYRAADGHQYNFDETQHIYLLSYKGKGHSEVPCIVGATSPATLFFTPAGDISFVSKFVSFGDDYPFDKDFCPLYKRADENFIIFWFAFRAQYNASQRESKFSKVFPELNDYLDKTYARISNEELKDTLRNDEKLLEQFEKNGKINLSNETSTAEVEIVGISLYAAPKIDVSTQSDFTIKATRKDIEGDLPLVLPCVGSSGSKYTKLKYTTSNWNTESKAQEQDERPLSERTLPNEGTKYPYLTMGDFLADTLLVNNSPGNEKKFFFAGQKGSLSALLPVKATWFDYFTVSDLKEHLKMEWKQDSQGAYLSVNLRVPIQHNVRGADEYVEYFKQYRDDDYKVARFSVGVYPFVLLDEGNADYRLTAFNTAQEGAGLVSLNTFAQQNPRKQIVMACERPNTNEEDRPRTSFPLQVSLYQAKGSRVDFIEVNYKDFSGLLVPNWEKPESYKEHVFAVDFGTSNTHVAGREKDGSEFTANELLCNTRFVFSHERDLNMPGVNTLVMQQLFPIGESEEQTAIKLPTRTVLAYGKSKDDKSWERDEVIPLVTGSIPFAYQTEELLAYQRPVYNLKWDTHKVTENQLRCYISNLLMMIRNKVLQNDGKLAETEIRWFYPLSMSRSKVAELRAVWDELYEKYFGNPREMVKSMCESLAPLGYFLRHEETTEQTCLVDIGGGTTDMAFAHQGKPQYLSSMRYAAGSLWGLDFNPDVERNGFVQRYRQKINEGLEDFPALDRVNQTLFARGNAVEILDFWLSLSNSTSKNDGKPAIDFAGMIKNDADMKPTLLMFYAAIIYHIAMISLAKGLELPRYIGFSGNGSRILRVLSASLRAEELTEFTANFLESVTGKQVHPKFELLFVKEPKELTCKGGLDYKDFDSKFRVEEHLVILRGDVGANGAIEIDPSAPLKIAEVLADKDAIENVKKQVGHFLQTLVAVENKIVGGYADIFGIKKGIFAQERDNLLIDVPKYIQDALRRRQEEQEDSDAELSETLFFYPIVGMIQEWARKVAGICIGSRNTYNSNILCDIINHYGKYGR